MLNGIKVNQNNNLAVSWSTICAHESYNAEYRISFFPKIETPVCWCLKSSRPSGPGCSSPEEETNAQNSCTCWQMLCGTFCENPYISTINVHLQVPPDLLHHLVLLWLFLLLQVLLQLLLLLHWPGKVPVQQDVLDFAEKGILNRKKQHQSDKNVPSSAVCMWAEVRSSETVEPASKKETRPKHSNR